MSYEKKCSTCMHSVRAFRNTFECRFNPPVVFIDLPARYCDGATDAYHQANYVSKCPEVDESHWCSRWEESQ